MADQKSTIKIDVEGVEKFLKTVQQVEKELVDIENLLKSKGFDGNQEKLRKTAVLYRQEMLAATNATAKAQLDNIKKVANAQAIATKVATRLTIGRGVGEFAQNIIRGLGDIIEKNKETDASMGELAKTIGKVQSGLASIGLVFLKVVAPVLNTVVGLIERAAYFLGGFNYQAAQTIDRIEQTKVKMQEETALLSDMNQLADERLKKISEYNKKYADILPILVNEKTTQEEINSALEFAKDVQSQRQAIHEDFRKGLITQGELEHRLAMEDSGRVARKAEFQDRQKAAQQVTLSLTLKELQAKAEIGKLTGLEQRRMDELLAQEQKRTEFLQRQLEIRQKFFDAVSQDVENLKKVSNEITTNIDEAIDADNFALIENQLLKTFDNITASIKKTIAPLEQDKKTISELTLEISNLDAELKNIQERKDINILDGIDEAITAERANLKRYKDDFNELSEVISTSISDSSTDLFTELTNLAGDTSRSQDFADAIEQAFLVINPISFGFNEDELKATIDKMGVEFKKIVDENGGIVEQDFDKVMKMFAKDSPLLNDLNDSIKRTNKELTSLTKTKKDDAKQSENDAKRVLEITKTIEDTTKRKGVLQKKVDDAGIEAEAELKKRVEEREAIVAKIAAKRLFNQKEAEAREIAALQKIKDSSPETFDLIDEFLLKTKQNSVENLTLIQQIVDAVKKAQGELKEGEGVVTFNQETGVTAPDTARRNQGANTQIQVAETLFTQLLALRKKQEEDLMNLDITSADERIEIFKKEFKLKERELNVDLKKTENAIEVSFENLSDTQEEFNIRQQKENRQANQDEIDIVNDQVDNLLRLEVERYQKENFLRVGAYLVKLKEFKKQGFDTKLLEKEFLQQELDLNIKHRKNLKVISDNYNEDDDEKRAARNKKIISDAIMVGQTLANEFMNLANAFNNLQDAIAQKLIDSLNDQISVIDERISETTSNIDELESDLEGKRSGRREALLRGIEIEKQREESLVEKKIELQKELERVEKEQSERRKEAAIAQAIMNYALAVTNVWANSTIPYPAQAVFGGIMSGVLSGIMALEIATIENQQFGKGGLLDFGQSHANGGIPAVVDGQTPIEVERGESIINAKSTSMYRPLLSAINKAGGGVEFARGGVAAEANFDMMSNALSPSTVKQLAMMGNQQVYVSVTDINNMQKRTAQVTDIATL